jgi:dihydroorotate dehydrogenase electron transfer subunit
MTEAISMTTGVILENRQTADDHCLMTVLLPLSFAVPAPGQFVMIRDASREEPLLSRPLSVYDFQRGGKDSAMDLLFRVSGRGTRILAALAPGSEVSILGPLGKGFTVPEEGRRFLFLAGGVGMAPLHFLLKQRFSNEGSCPVEQRIFYLGARSDGLLLGRERLRQVCDLRICTDDGSAGFQGTVTERLKSEIAQCDPDRTTIFACGPAAMIRSLGELLRDRPIPCQVSVEERMACGLGACLGCAVEVQGREGKKSYVRVCREGPVFELGEILMGAEDTHGE